MNILLFGASGFIGSRIAAVLCARGHTLTTPSHREADFFALDPARVRPLFAGQDVVVNAVGIMHRRADALETVHHHAPAQLAAWAVEAGVPRWVQLSALGADAILLIVAALSDEELATFTRIAHDLALDVLVEVHDEAECERALKLPLRVIGVNNRNLHDFSVSLDTSRRIKAMLPPDYLLVCESGIHSRADVESLQADGINAFLVGGALMQAEDPGAALAALLA